LKNNFFSKKGGLFDEGSLTILEIFWEVDGDSLELSNLTKKESPIVKTKDRQQKGEEQSHGGRKKKVFKY